MCYTKNEGDWDNENEKTVKGKIIYDKREGVIIWEEHKER